MNKGILRFAFSVVAAALLVSSQADASTITWSGSALAGTGTTLISTTGTAVEAHNVGEASSIAAGGVTFDSAGFDPFLTGNFFVGFDATGLTGDANFDSILNSGVYSTADATLVLNGLTIGSSYLVQIFVADTRGGSASSRQVTVGAPYPQSKLQSGSLGSGFVFNGTFAADAVSQSIIFHGDPDGIPYLNAYQLRDTTDATTAAAVPEPASLLLLGTGLVVVASRLRSRG